MPKIKERFDYIDQFRGFIGILMLLGHSSYYFNDFWLAFDPLNPLFPSQGQFILRYIGYLCAPGFLIMAGAMVWLSYQRSVEKGTKPLKAKWYYVQRGLFLVLVQMTWVNSSWSGFARFDPWHLGIIASIGISVILLTTVITTRWYIRGLIAAVILIIHPFLVELNYNVESVWQSALMQLFVISGEFNKYPVLPWFALALLGSVMAGFWFKVWNDSKKRFIYSFIVGGVFVLVALVVRLVGGYGNIFEYSEIGSFAFFADQKYPPSLFHNLWFFGWVVLFVAMFQAIAKYAPYLTRFLGIVGKVPMFYYAIHIAILGIFVKRIDFLYREGGITTTLIGFAVMLVVMMFLARWFYKIKARSTNYLIRMI
jgi:uncharacterized membrane protein